jgi:hypothetical protein
MPRYLVHLLPEADWDGVRDALLSAGFAQVADPTPELPGVAIASVDDEDRAVEAARLAAAIPGVRLVEPDQMQTIL